MHRQPLPIAILACLLASCTPSGDATPAANDVAPTAVSTAPDATTADTQTPAPSDPTAPDAVAKAAPAPVPPSDPDNPLPLPALQFSGAGAGVAESRYYTFDAEAGKIVVAATAKNSPSGSTQALGFALYDAKANRLCFDSHGNTTDDKTVVLNCTVEQAQPLLLRLDLSPESLDYAIKLSGPVALPKAAAIASGTAATGAGSSDIDEPTRLTTNKVKADGTGKAVSYYYTFNAGPGELTLTGDGYNTSAATTEALTLSLYTLRSERLCELSLGNTLRDRRVVTTCALDKRQPVILRADLSAETVAFRARFDGPHDFEEYVAPPVITIALDSSVLFDTGRSELKAEARDELREAAARVKKFPGASVLVSGHTDSTGTAAGNAALSRARADAVRDWFVSQEGVASGMLTTQGLGSAQPVADNGSDAGRARNRRVDVVITPKK